MIFNIAQFRSIVDGYNGFQKLNRYRIRIPPALGLMGQTSLVNNYPVRGTLTYLEYFCNTVDLPGVALITRQINRYGYGPLEKKPIAPLFNDIMMTFYNDGINANLNLFHDWFKLISNFNMSHGITSTTPRGVDVYELHYKIDYAVDAEITLFDNAGRALYTMVMRDFYPIMIPDTKMSMEPQPTVMQIVVNFTYMDWYLKKPEDGSSVPPPDTGAPDQARGIPVNPNPQTP